MTTAFLFGIAAFVAFNALDIITTFIVIKTGGGEGNPIARFVLRRWGLFSLIVLKVIAIAIVLASVLHTFSFAALFSTVSLWCYNAVMTYVVLHNVRVRRRLRSE